MCSVFQTFKLQTIKTSHVSPTLTAPTTPLLFIQHRPPVDTELGVQLAWSIYLEPVDRRAMRPDEALMERI